VSFSTAASGAIDRLLTDLTSGRSPGGAAALIRDGEVVLARGYGLADLATGAPVTTDSVFYLASVSKQFTAAAVALLVDDGVVSLDDDVRKFVPEVPDFGARITLGHLAHHTSGLRDYFGLLAFAGWPADGPLTDRRLLDLVGRQRALNFEPGAEFLYCNTGYVLLAIVVSRASGLSLRRFADERIFGPLGMASTRFRDDHAEPIDRLAIGYVRDEHGGFRPKLPDFDTVGDGGVFSTLGDLARWDGNFRRMAVGGPRVAAMMLERGALNDGTRVAYGMGLVVDRYRGVPTVEHTGEFGGYRTAFVRFPEDHVSIAVLCNRADGDAAFIAHRIADAGLGDRFPEPSPLEGVALDPALLSRYEGTYWNGTIDAVVDVSVGDGALRAGSRRGASPWVARSETAFTRDPGSMALRFVADHGSWRLDLDGGGGQLVQFTRAAPPARPAAAYPGTYRSAELDVAVRIVLDDGALTLARPDGSSAALKPVVDDVFAAADGAIWRFGRGRAGAVVSVACTAGGVRRLVFDRQPD